LRSVLEAASADIGCSLTDLTVLSAQVDPYRLDTASGHRDGAWLAKELNRAIGRTRRIHWRGLHYALVAKGNVRKPNGVTYVNTDEDWTWLSSVAGKAARWLGYVPFERITDNRNDGPVVHRKARVTPEAGVSVGLEVSIPDVDDLEPFPFVTGFIARQAYQFAIFGEKASLEDVVLPIARRNEADLYLGAGEISDTHAHQIASDAAADGRPLVVFTLTDCDPAGYQMSVSLGRKLQALRDLLFTDLKFELVPVALTVDQVRELGLPSTPLKETEKRASRWREAFGIDQTEIDALATLRPDVLRELIERAFDPYLDRTLEARVEQAHDQWRESAQQAINDQVDLEHLQAIREQAAERLAEMEETIAEINERVRVTAGDHFTLPQIEVPEPEVSEDAARQALVRFDDDWVAATRALTEAVRNRGRRMTRERLRNRRASVSFDFEAQGLRFTATISRFEGGGLAEIFIVNHKAGSMAGINACDAAVVTSIALQYGAPLDVIRKALMRDSQGRASSPLGVALDQIGQDEDG
jgi:hypothetical protein